MKKTLSLAAFIMLMSALAFFFASCNDTDDGKFVEPISLYEKVNGNWMVTNVMQIDETAVSLNLTPKEISLFGQLDFETFGLSLNVDERSAPTSFKVTGSSPELFLQSGFWELSNPFQVTTGTQPTINLYEDATKNQLKAKLTIVKLPTSTQTMEVKLTRYTEGQAFVSYLYKLVLNN